MSQPEESDAEFITQNQQSIQQSQSSSEESQLPGNEVYGSLNDLIRELNDQDHSQDQGIQDYKTGGYHPCHIGQTLINRYVLIQKLGWGHFSTVWLAKDFKYNTYVAVKVMKSAPHYLDASYDQIEILQKVAKNSFHPQWLKALKSYQPDKKKYDRDDSHVLNLLNAFIYKGPYGNHFCMVFEILGVNLWQILKKNDYKGLPINIVKEITRQILMGLDFLNRVCRVIHTDLKPQNVLVCLTPEQLKKIVQDGQLHNNTDFRDRLNYYCQKFNLGPPQYYPQQEQKSNEDDSSLQSDDQGQQPSSSQISILSSKILQLNEKMQDQQINKNYRKTLKKKLKKYEQELEKQKLLAEQRSKKNKQKQKLTKKEKKVQLPQKPKNISKKKKTVKQLFSNFKNKLSFDTTQGGISQSIKVKIADLGNACWQHHHFATEIQTRQYRGPQVLLGSKYDINADMWSLACMTFELLTGQVLFNPKKDPDQKFGKNDDHLAQMMQLLGRFPKKMSIRGEKAKKYISKTGCLNRIPRLQNWSLKDVMIAKYRYQEDQAAFFEDFMIPMLQCHPQKRKNAQQLLKHKWLSTPAPQQYLIDYQTHQKLRSEKYDTVQQKQEIYQYESQGEDADYEDNNHDDGQDLYQVQKTGTIKLIDRSFTDLGYIGYQNGIFLDKLDMGANWQFS